NADSTAEPNFRRLSELRHGTAVLWQKLDRLVAGQSANNDKQHQLFLHRTENVRQHLGMVFHRIMTERRAVDLFVNGRIIPPWDPFLVHEAATQTLPATRLKLRHSVVEIQPFVLPHHSKIAKSTYDAAAGPRGWNAHQGFYIYRNRRLLVAGDWLGFGWTKEEHYKLARIRVD